jgi:hypothetical protein
MITATELVNDPTSDRLLLIVGYDHGYIALFHLISPAKFDCLWYRSVHEETSRSVYCSLYVLIFLSPENVVTCMVITPDRTTVVSGSVKGEVVFTPLFSVGFLSSPLSRLLSFTLLYH